MVSNLDTENKINLEEAMHHTVANQSEEEILDYLMNQEVSNPRKHKEKSFDQLRKNINNNYNKLKSQAAQKPAKYSKGPSAFETISSMLENTGSFIIDTLQLTFARLKVAYGLASKLSDVEFLMPVKTFIEKLKNTQIARIELTPEQAATLRTKYKPVKEKLSELSDVAIDKIGVSKEYAMETATNLNQLVLENFPKYRKTFISTLILVGCGLMTIVSQVIIQHNNQKEDLLSSNKIVPINWNVNGQISDAERNNIKGMLASGQIKVLPKARSTTSKIQLVTTTSSLSNKGLSPDDSLMMISANSINHTVFQGESILSISQKYKVSISDLISSNPDTDLINLKPGDKVSIPNTMDAIEMPAKPSRAYSKIPRNLIASRSASGLSRSNNFLPVTPGIRGMAWPVPASRTISSRYGPRWGGFHPGIDITAPTGTPIVATRDGVVISSGWEGGYGKCVIIDHGNGISTRYAHASSLNVRTGQPVRAGQIVARIGSTGWSTGPHLHYEVLINGRHNNPMRYF